MPDYAGEAATVLPSIAPSIGDQLRYQQERKDQQFYRQDQVRSQREARKLQLINHVESSIDPSKFLIGESTIDQHTTQQLESVKSDMLKFLKANSDADPMDVAYQIQQQVAPIAITHAKQKAMAADIDKNLLAAKGDLPVLNDGKLRDEARKRAFLKQLPDGSYTYKSPEEMQTGQNYVQDVINNNPEAVVDNAQPFIKNLQSLKTEDAKGKTGDMYAGVRTKTSYNAKLSPFRELDVAKDGTVNGLKYKAENITLPGGKQMQVAPQQQFDLATSDPNAKLAFYKLWNENKQKYGVGNLSNDDPSSQVMQRKFLLDYLQATNIDHSSYSSDDEVYKNAQRSDVEAGYGTREQQFQRRENYRQGNREKNEASRNEDINKRMDKAQEFKKELKLIPAAKSGKATINKKENKYGI